MVMKLYALYDRVAEESGPIAEAKNDGVALRMYQHMLASKQLPPDDYQLICVGEWNRDTLDISPIGERYEVTASKLLKEDS